MDDSNMIFGQVWLLWRNTVSLSLACQRHLCDLLQLGSFETGERFSNSDNNVVQVFRIRREFLQAVLSQDISWYDTNTTTHFASSITEY